MFFSGLIGVLFTMFSWWSDIINEAEDKGDHTPVVQLHHRYGMILFILSEVMFFVAWFWAFFNSSLFPADDRRACAHRRVRGGLAAQGHRSAEPLEDCPCSTR